MLAPPSMALQKNGNPPHPRGGRGAFPGLSHDRGSRVVRARSGREATRGGVLAVAARPLLGEWVETKLPFCLALAEPDLASLSRSRSLPVPRNHVPPLRSPSRP